MIETLIAKNYTNEILDIKTISIWIIDNNLLVILMNATSA
jgi:hypothetical protein